MFSVSESGERAEAEGQERAAVAWQLHLPWQSPHSRVGAGAHLLSVNPMGKIR